KGEVRRGVGRRRWGGPPPRALRGGGLRRGWAGWRGGRGAEGRGRERMREWERANWAASRSHQSHTPLSNAFRTSE
ncbi:MAG: hypothetical protein ACKESB_02235, partial [Candidatus Hodgkinia cicadicola]